MRKRIRARLGIDPCIFSFQRKELVDAIFDSAIPVKETFASYLLPNRHQPMEALILDEMSVDIVPFLQMA
jgi:hypothetical protein